MSGTIPWTAIYPDGPSSGRDGTVQVSVPGGGPLGGGGVSVLVDLPRNAAYPGLPEGVQPRHVDLSVNGAGTWTLWTPSSGRRIILTHVMISSDTAQRVAVVEDADVPGRRAVDGFVGASGGLAADLTPAPYVASPGMPLRLVVGTGGNVSVQASGYEV